MSYIPLDVLGAFMPEGDGLKRFETALEIDHLRRALRFQQWLNAGIAAALVLSNCLIVWMLTSHHAKQIASAVNAMARAVK